jgi:hypothetical protein
MSYGGLRKRTQKGVRRLKGKAAKGMLEEGCRGGAMNVTMVSVVMHE